MPFLLLILIGLGLAWHKGWLRGWTWADGLALLAGLAGLRLLLGGRLLIALPLLALAVLRAGRIWTGRRALPSTAKPAPPIPMSIKEALAILDLGHDADRAAIMAAHRAMIARLHPDRGGSTPLAAQVNQARDILLAQIERSGSISPPSP